jgi:hypothetical protein
MLFPLVKVRRTQILIWLPPRQYHIDDDEDGMSNRNQGAFLPPAGGNPSIGFFGDLEKFRALEGGEHDSCKIPDSRYDCAETR